MEVETNPVTEVETTAPEADEVVTDQTEAEGESVETDGLTEEELEELEEEGERYSLPKKLAGKFKEYKEGHMKASDYTQKTQALAEEKRTLQQRSEAQAANLKLHAEAFALHQQLEQYKALDWNKAADDDPVETQKLWIRYQNLKAAHAERVNAISNYEHQQQEQSKQETANRLREAAKVISSEIKGWSPELAKSLNEHGISSGFNMEELTAAAQDPRQIRILHKAYLYDQLMKKTAQKPALPDPKPIQTVGKNAKAGSPLPQDSDSMEVWVKKERARMAKKRSN